MKTRIQIPTAMEVRSFHIDEEKGEIVIEHRFISGINLVQALKITAEGDEGVKKEYSLLVHGGKGSYRIVPIEDAPTPTEFDLPVAKYLQQREVRSERMKKKKRKEKEKPSAALPHGHVPGTP